MHFDVENLKDLQVFWSLWDDLECVYEHVTREGDIEVPKPQELSAMAKHGILKRKQSCLRGYTSYYIIL